VGVGIASQVVPLGVGYVTAPPAVVVGGPYLDAMVGTVSTPDPGPWPSPCVFVVDLDGPVIGGGAREIAAQFDGPGREWRLIRESAANVATFGVIAYPSGTTSPIEVTYANNQGQVPIDGTRQRWAIAFTRDNGSGLRACRLYKRTGSGAWVQQGTERTGPAIAYTDVSSALRIGNWLGGSNPWSGRIYSVELRTGLDPTAGTVVWRFDAKDWPGAGTIYVDPRGRTWTLTTVGAIVDP
jgi:hypothetical protein